MTTPNELRDLSEPAATDERLVKVLDDLIANPFSDRTVGFVLRRHLPTILAALKAEPAHDDGLVERVAKAMHRAECMPHAEGTGYGKHWGWDDAMPAVRERHINAAHAAVNVMSARIEALEAALVESREREKRLELMRLEAMAMEDNFDAQIIEARKKVIEECAAIVEGHNWTHSAPINGAATVLSPSRIALKSAAQAIRSLSRGRVRL